LQPDFILMDVEMPVLNGIEATWAITRHQPQVRVLMLATPQDRSRAFACLMAGAVSYLLKTVPPDEMLEAVRRAAGGGAVLPPDLTAEVVTAQGKLTRRQGDKGTI